MASFVRAKKNGIWTDIPAIRGLGIKEVTKSTVGLTDTYTITYTDNTTYTFTVTNSQVYMPPTVTLPYSANVEIQANAVTTLTLSGATTVTLGSGVEGYDNEWTIIVSMPDPAVTLTLPTISWGLGVVPTFDVGTTTILRLYYINETLNGEWVAL